MIWQGEMGHVRMGRTKIPNLTGECTLKFFFVCVFFLYSLGDPTTAIVPEPAKRLSENQLKKLEMLSWCLRL